jgi:hypothetical protein
MMWRMVAGLSHYVRAAISSHLIGLKPSGASPRPWRMGVHYYHDAIYADGILLHRQQGYGVRE